MRISRSSLRRSRAVAAILMGIALPGLSLAWPGGGGTAISPYKPNEPVDAMKVARIRNEANRLKPATGFKGNGKGHCERVRFAYINPRAPRLVPEYSLTGTSPHGRSLVVELNCMNTLTVLRVDPGSHQAFCAIEIFPTIKPAKITREQPSYSTLDTQYRLTVRLWIDLGDAQRGVLTLVGSSSRDKDRADVRVPFQALPRNQIITFTGVRPDLKPIYWWAIPSVTADPRYPIRLQTRS